MWQLRMHCNLRPPEPRQPFPALTTTSCQVWSRWTYPLTYYSVFAADTFQYAVTLNFDPVTLTFDLERLQRIACDVMKLCTKFERYRAIGGGVIAILVYDLMTLKIALRVALGSGIIFTKFDLRQLIHSWIIAFLMLIRYVTLWPWPLTRWSWKLKVRETSSVTWSKSARHLSEIGESRGELLIIWRTFAHVMPRCDLDLLTLNICSTLGGMRLNSLQNLSEIE